MARVTQDLSGHLWQMERMRVGEGEREGFHILPPELQGATYSWNYATVPGDVYTDLQRAGELEDPYYGRNMHKAKWVQEYEWWYITKFNVSEEMKGKEIKLTFEGVDYSCKVWLNGAELGSHEGMFSPFSFRVTEFVTFEQWSGGSNILAIRLDPPPKNIRNVGGRKVNFGGDYFTGLAPFGIWRPVKLIATEEVSIQSYRTEYDIRDREAVVKVELEVENRSERARTVQVDVELKGHNFESRPYRHTCEVVIEPGLQQAETSVTIPEPELWWPWDMGKPHLYDIQFTLSDAEKALDNVQGRIGIREVRMERNPGFTEEEAEFPWTFFVNGKRHYLRSACWGGQPSFLYGRNYDEKYEHLLQLAREGNLNNVRIFGWHPPEIPKFYELCDELGITVWTNFPLATQVYPEDAAFVEATCRECIEIVKMRRNHPSNIYWMGGEEVFFTDGHFKSKNKELMEAIGEAIQSFTSVPYGLATPLSNEVAVRMGFKRKESKHANGHYYSGGRHFMEEYFPSIDAAIIPELTAASSPSVESLKKFIPTDELWPMGPSWGYHWADVDFLKGLNLEVFGDMRMGSLEEFVNATQITQGTVFQFALELFRRRKPRVSGVSLCHFITHWPDMKWGIVDYYGKTKISYDFVKRSYQPLLASLEFPKRRWMPGESLQAGLWAVNDYHHAYPDVVYVWKVKDDAGNVLHEGRQRIDVEADSSRKIGELEWTVDPRLTERFSIDLRLEREDGRVLSDNAYTLLIGDQEEAKRACEAFARESVARREKWGRSYYRYELESWKLE